jgi:hypothetical protein
MRITGGAVILVVAAASLRASVPPAQSRPLTICMGMTIGNLVIENEARNVASDIFAGIGVKIRWRGAERCPSEAISIFLSRDTPASVHPGALAYALPYQRTQIVALLDRIKHAAPYDSGCLLGYTLAHEVAHILEGVARHSPSGIMKAQWGTEDFVAMGQHRLDFAGQDVSLIYQGLDRRELRASSAANGVQVE